MQAHVLWKVHFLGFFLNETSLFYWKVHFLRFLNWTSSKNPKFLIEPSGCIHSDTVSWSVCICHAVPLYEESFCVQWLRATALRREPSPAWPWPGWASSPPTWCWLASRQTGWATCWRQSSTSLSFKEHLISILLWGFLGNFKSQWWLLPFFTTHPQCMLHTNAYPEWGMVSTSPSTSKLRRLCRAMLKVLSHVSLL